MMLDGNTPTPVCQGPPGPALLQDRAGTYQHALAPGGQHLVHVLGDGSALQLQPLASVHEFVLESREQSSAQARHRRGWQSRGIPAATPQPPTAPQHTAPLTPTGPPAATPGSPQAGGRKGGRESSPPPIRRRRRPGPQHPARLPRTGKTPGDPPPAHPQLRRPLGQRPRLRAPPGHAARRHLPQVRGAAVRPGPGREGSAPPAPSRPVPPRPSPWNRRERGHGAAAVSARRCFPAAARGHQVVWRRRGCGKHGLCRHPSDVSAIRRRRSDGGRRVAGIGAARRGQRCGCRRSLVLPCGYRCAVTAAPRATGGPALKNDNPV